MSSRARSLPSRLFVILLMLSFFIPGITGVVKAAERPMYDVTVYGCGMSGFAAAIQAARMGVNVAVVEPTDWCGGQASAAGESNMDVGWYWNPLTPIEYKQMYKEFQDRLVIRYGGADYVRQGLYSDIQFSFEPHIVFDEIMRWFAEERVKGSRIDVFFNREIQGVIIEGQKLTGISVLNAETNKLESFTASQTIDASESGDLIRLSGAYYRSGKDVMPGGLQETYIQDMTYMAIVQQFAPGQTPVESRFSQPPPGWTPEIAKAMGEYFVNGPGGWERGEHPFGWPKSLAGTKGYRGMPRILSPDTLKSTNPGEASRIQKAGINFVFNDYPVLSRYNTDLEYRRVMNCRAKVHTMYLLYQFQLLGWDLAVSSEEGYQDSAYNKRNLCPEIPAELKNIELRMPLYPYLREANRLLGQVTVATTTMMYQKVDNLLNPYGPMKHSDPQSVAVCGYASDIHQNKKTLAEGIDPAIDNLEDQQRSTIHSRFQVPWTAFYPLQGHGNKVEDGIPAVGDKASGSRGFVAGTRLQPSEVLTGQAAGAGAALAARQGIPASQVSVEDAELLDIARPIVKEFGWGYFCTPTLFLCFFVKIAYE